MSLIVNSTAVSVDWLERALRPLWFGGDFFVEYKPATGDVLPVRVTWSGKVWRAVC